MGDGERHEDGDGERREDGDGERHEDDAMMGAVRSCEICDSHPEPVYIFQSREVHRTRKDTFM
jgi:hypothetical protein